MTSRHEQGAAFTADVYGRANACRVEKAADLLPMLREAIGSRGITVVDCPVDYRQSLVLTERLGALVGRN